MKPFSFESYHDSSEIPAFALKTVQAWLCDWQGQPGQNWKRLSGGFRNQNYALKLHRQTCVLRVSQDLPAFRREIALLRHFKHQALTPGALPLPQVLASTELQLKTEAGDQELGLALLSFCPGQTGLMAVQQSSQQDLLELGLLIGRSLFCLHHSLSFVGPGFIDEQLKLTSPYYPQISHEGLAYRAYIVGVLSQPQTEQVCGRQRQQAMLLLLAKHSQRFQQVNGQGLRHGDFNLKNMLLQRTSGSTDATAHGQLTASWQLTAILDWEFASAGSPLGDIGNFYRFDHRLPVDLFVGFAQGYGPLSPDQLLTARLIDLASMCNFLERAAGPRSLVLVNEIFDKTLALFAANDLANASAN